MAQRGMAPILVVILITVVALAGGFWIYQSNPSIPPNPSPTPKVACTHEAKICPDGSSVGRTGPKCAFAPCPTPESTSSAVSPVPNGTGETANWKTYRSNYFSASYPSDWHIWSFGRGFDLEYWQINSVPANQQAAKNASYISFDIQGMTYTYYNTLDEYRSYLKKLQKEMPQYNLTISSLLVNEQEAAVSEKTIDSNPYYEKIVWFVSGGKKYIITWIVQAQTIQERDDLKEKHEDIFNQILSTFKFLDQNALDQNDGDCQPRPACLDATTTPRCLMPEPAEGWCP